MRRSADFGVHTALPGLAAHPNRMWIDGNAIADAHVRNPSDIESTAGQRKRRDCTGTHDRPRVGYARRDTAIVLIEYLRLRNDAIVELM